MVAEGRVGCGARAGADAAAFVRELRPLAGVVETPEGKLYPQLHGPATRVAAQRPTFVGFVEGLTQAPAADD